MSSKIEILVADPRVIALVNSVSFSGGKGCHYYAKSDGHQVFVISEILRLHSVGRNVAIRAVQQLLGIPPKAKRESRSCIASACPVETPRRPNPHNDAAALPELPTSKLERYQIVKRTDRRTNALLFGFFDTKTEIETVRWRTRLEALSAIDEMEIMEKGWVVSYHKNGFAR